MHVLRHQEHTRSGKRPGREQASCTAAEAGRGKKPNSPHFVFNVLNNKILHAGTAEADELMGLAWLIRSNLILLSVEGISCSRARFREAVSGGGKSADGR